MPALDTTTEWMRLLSEPTRVRLLAVLDHEELSVAELTGITQLGQSRVSTHLGRLREAGLVRDRRVGSSAYYSRNDSGMSGEVRRIWDAVVATTQDAVLDRDRARARDVVEARERGLSWADAVAGQMERHYSPGRTWEATARGLLGLCRLGDVLDVGSGDGALAELVAPCANTVTCLDLSPRVIAAARRRLKRLRDKMRFVVGDMHELPFDAASFDAVLLMNGLTYAERPAEALLEAARVLRPGGLLTGVTLLEHDQRSTVSAYGHVNQGFSPERLSRLIVEAGLEVDRCEVTSRESRRPHFEIITFFAHKGVAPSDSAPSDSAPSDSAPSDSPPSDSAPKDTA